VVDNILKKSKLTDEQAKELAKELEERVAKRHGLI
jgi:polyhydroxyalkanoate synthesis regulator phasin